MLDLTWWQAFALVGIAVASLLGGRLLGVYVHHVLYRRVLLTRTALDDRLVLRLEAPFAVAGVVLVWHLLVSLIDLPLSVLAFCRNVGHIGLLLAIGWGAIRLIDTGLEHLVSRSQWITDQRLAQSLLPLGRRIAKAVIGALVAVMVLARMGYSVGPLLVVLAIAGASLALAAHRLLENVLAAYAILGDHGIREGDTVTLDGGITGTIELIGLYSTRLRTAAGSHVIVPNRRLADAQIERAFQRPSRPLGAVPAPSSVGQPRTAGGLS